MGVIASTPRAGIPGPHPFLWRPSRLNRLEPGEGQAVEFGVGGAPSEALGWALPASGGGEPATGGRSGCHAGSVGSSRTAASTCCAEAAAGAQRRRVPSPSRPVPGGLSGPREPSQLFQRLPFQPRSKLEPRCALRRDVRRAGACLGAAHPPYPLVFTKT